MSDRELLRGLALIAISLVFGLQALRYPMGHLALAGPGLFPLVVSSLLFLVGAASVIRSRFTERVPMSFSIRNIGLIVGSLVAFTVISEYVNMIAGIIAMVFCASAAVPSYSVVRNFGIAAGLIVVAFAFQKLFGLELNLY